MRIDEFDELFFQVVGEINSEPVEVVMSRFPPGKVTLEEAMALMVRESKEYAEKLVYRVLAEIFVDE